jgi:acetolactate synthase I/II/III large subunit
MNKAEALVEELSKLGVQRCYIVTGGAAMFINLAVAMNSLIKTFAVHHEQTASMAAEGSFRSSGSVALVSVTAGPGALNAINGVFGAYVDSIPMIILSGQARTDTLRLSKGLSKLRQLGDQEANVVYAVKPFVKAAIQVSQEDDVRELARSAMRTAVSGRPGPVWIDFPVDIQSQKYMRKKNEDSRINKIEIHKDFSQKETLDSLIDLILRSERPLFLFGTGVSNERGRKAIDDLQSFATIPIQPAWTAIDLVPYDSRLFAGRPSTVGDRAGGLIQHAADLNVVFGSSLSIRQVGFNSDSHFQGNLVQIDIDEHYREKPFPKNVQHITMNPTIALEYIVSKLKFGGKHNIFENWLSRCQRVVAEVRDENSWFEELSDGLNPYDFLREISMISPENSLFVCSDATASVVFFQVANLKKDQRTFTNAGSASMGYELPAAIGAATSSNRPVICLAGDGSIQQNLQELATISGLGLDIRIILLDNNGYLSIRASQEKHFENVFFESKDSGLFFPKFKELSHSYSFPYFEVSKSNRDLNHLKSAGPHFTRVILSPTFTFTPKASSRLSSSGQMVSSPIYDLEPFIDERELKGTLDFLQSKGQ